MLNNLIIADGSSFSVSIYAGLGLAVGIIVIHFIVRGVSGLKRERSGRKLGMIEKLVYLGVLGCIGALGVSAFLPILTHGHMTGYYMLLHTVFAGAFLLMFTLYVLLWSEDHVFTCEQGGGNEGEKGSPFRRGSKICFWIMLLAGILAIGSMLVNMLPYLSTSQQAIMIDLHRYTSLCVVLTGIIHAYMVLIGKRSAH